MDRKVCVTCSTETSIDICYNRYRDCKQCSMKTSLKRYYENKENISNQQTI